LKVSGKWNYLGIENHTYVCGESKFYSYVYFIAQDDQSGGRNSKLLDMKNSRTA
jgi:hypothetical protein